MSLASDKEVARRLAALEQAADDQQRDVGYEVQLAGLDSETRSAIEALSPVDRERWITGMEWFGSLPDPSFPIVETGRSEQ